MEEEENVVFSNIEVRVKHAGPSGLGDLEVTEYIAHTQRAVREGGRRICPPGNDRSKIHAGLTAPITVLLYFSHANCIYHI